MGGSVEEPPDWSALQNINPQDLEDSTVDQVDR
jgi:hypothetical protein